MANITIPQDIAEKVLALYDNVASADAHYKRCQADNFRLHVKSVYQAAEMQQAFTALRQQMDAQQAEAARSPQKARRGVLTDA